MASPYLLPLLLVFHITGLVMMAGAALTEFAVFLQFWKILPKDPQRAMILRQATEKLPVMVRIGGILLIITGVSMVAVFHGVIAEQLWFRIKMGLVLLIIINGVIIARSQVMKLQKVLADGSGAFQVQKIDALKGRIMLSLSFQLILFFLIFVLSIFKFN
jgi:hypothetical protein